MPELGAMEPGRSGRAEREAALGIGTLRMDSKVSPFPGVHCAYFVQGRCLYEESRNPGLNTAWRCKVLAAWEEEYERFLTQAENFDLEIELATRIWQQRLSDLIIGPSPCPDYQPGRPAVQPGEGDEDEPDIACAFSWIGLCLFALPACSGVCNHFAARPDAAGEVED